MATIQNSSCQETYDLAQKFLADRINYLKRDINLINRVFLQKFIDNLTQYNYMLSSSGRDDTLIGVITYDKKTYQEFAVMLRKLKIEEHKDLFRQMRPLVKSLIDGKHCDKTTLDEAFELAGLNIIIL